MRAKPIRLQSPSWPGTEKVTWKNQKQLEVLLQDLDLSLVKEKDACHEMIQALNRIIGEYKSALTFLANIPRLANRLAELNELLPTLEKGYQGLLELSFMARQDVKNARVNAKAEAGQPIVLADVAQSQRTEQAIDCAPSDLIELTIAFKQAIQNLSKERRGRRHSPVPVLVKQLGSLFDQFDRGDHDNDKHRHNARTAFVDHVLTYSGISVKGSPTRKRLASILSNP